VANAEPSRRRVAASTASRRVWQHLSFPFLDVVLDGGDEGVERLL
jgi:hypothetical protein